MSTEQPHTATAVAVANQTNTAAVQPVARWTPEQIQAASFEAGAPVPSLAAAEVVPLPIGTEYWSPENPGEFKRVFIAGIQPTEIVDPQTGESKIMEAVFMLEVVENEKGEQQALKWMNAGRVLVGNIKAAIERSQIVPGTGLTPVQITYRGQTKNRSNSRLSKRWEILPLVVNAQQAA